MKVDLTESEINVLINAMHIAVKETGWEALTPVAIDVKMKLTVAAQAAKKLSKGK